MVLIIASIFLKSTILNLVISNFSDKMKNKYQCSFTVGEAAFEGFSTIKVAQLCIAPQEKDTLAKIQEIKIAVGFWHLLIGEIEVESLSMKNGKIKLIKNKNGSNFEMFLKSNKNTETTNYRKNYSQTTYHLIKKFLMLVPAEMNIENLFIEIDDVEKKINFNFSDLLLSEKKMKSTVLVSSDNFSQNWSFSGYADPRNMKMDISLTNSNKKQVDLPFLEQKYKLKSSFDTIRLAVQNIEQEGDNLRINVLSSIKNFQINHPKIARQDVVINDFFANFHFLLSPNSISAESSSTIGVNKIKVNPYFSYNTEKDTVYNLSIKIPKMKAQDFVSSLPGGLFSHFKDVVVLGDFDYSLDFIFNKNKPYRLVFRTNLNKEGLKIIKYGNANLNKLNGEFVYRAIINDVPQRAVYVGTSNPNYTPLDEISPYLQNCILACEDPSFFTHKGFISEAFRQSIIKDIKTGKFARGASTISMQLIKNVFLTREKTVSRKLEEILLVYILENNRIVSKKRMFEVYLNIIEWGPNVYGIGEASHFYFQKSPAELTLNECLYLATIIPKPKKFIYQFDDKGELRTFADKNRKFITRLMLKRGFLVPDDTLRQEPLKITGKALEFMKLVPVDSVSVPVDSLFIEPAF